MSGCAPETRLGLLSLLSELPSLASAAAASPRPWPSLQPWAPGHAVLGAPFDQAPGPIGSVPGGPTSGASGGAQSAPRQHAWGGTAACAPAAAAAAGGGRAPRSRLAESALRTDFEVICLAA